MKTKILLSILMLLILGTTLNAQELRVAIPGEKATNYLPEKDTKLLSSPEFILGKWIAEDGNMSYKLEFIKDTIRFDNMIDDEYHFSEYILGKITYLKNGEIIRETSFDGLNSVLRSRLRDSYDAYLNYEDKEQMVWYGAKFTIDKNNTIIAQWKLGAPQNDFYGNWNIYKPDIPKELTFTKIE